MALFCLSSAFQMLRKCIAFAECKSHTEFRDQRFVKWNSHPFNFCERGDTEEHMEGGEDEQ